MIATTDIGAENLKEIFVSYGDSPSPCGCCRAIVASKVAPSTHHAPPYSRLTCTTPATSTPLIALHVPTKARTPAACRRWRLPPACSSVAAMLCLEAPGEGPCTGDHSKK